LRRDLDIMKEIKHYFSFPLLIFLFCSALNIEESLRNYHSPCRAWTYSTNLFSNRFSCHFFIIDDRPDICFHSVTWSSWNNIFLSSWCLTVWLLRVFSKPIVSFMLIINNNIRRVAQETIILDMKKRNHSQRIVCLFQEYIC